jgi:hypothetical protein
LNPKRCAQCKRPFTVAKPSEMRSRMYCSRACAYAARVVAFFPECQACGSKILGPGRARRRFCSRKCYSADKRKELKRSKVCGHCRTAFIPSSAIAVYCSRECFYALRRGRHATEKRCKDCGDMMTANEYRNISTFACRKRCRSCQFGLVDVLGAKLALSELAKVVNVCRSTFKARLRATGDVFAALKIGPSRNACAQHERNRFRSMT